MICFPCIGHVARLLLVLSALLISGCGKDTTEPITDLTDEQKKQVQELNEQRADEWGSTRK